MAPEQSSTPDSLDALVEQALSFVEKSLGLAPDGQPETLPLIDHYLSQVPVERPELVDLVSAAIGAYFGELVRRRFNGRWLSPEADPKTWRILLPRCEASFSPVGMVYEAIVQGREDRMSGRLDVAMDDQNALTRFLERLGGVPEDEFYTLCNRYDTLETVVDFLVALREKRPGPEDR